MISAILVFNNHGKPRVNQFYNHYVRFPRFSFAHFIARDEGHIIRSYFYYLTQTESEQQQIIKETFQLVSKREDHVCNFLEGGSLVGGEDFKLIYRHYATLYFVFCVDSSESELGILDLIQVGSK